MRARHNNVIRLGYHRVFELLLLGGKMTIFCGATLWLAMLTIVALPHSASAQSLTQALSPNLQVPSAPAFLPETTDGQPASLVAPTSLSVPVTLPQPFEATISSISALATGAGAALKTNRSDARTLIVRLALANAIVSAKPPIISITLSADPSLVEDAVLCTPRINYVSKAVYLNYLNTLVQNINAISAKAATPTDIPGALRLLLATTNYSITDKVKTDTTTLDALSAATKKNCENDLSTYAKDYYGITPGGGGASPEVATTGGTSVNTFAFLGPIGTLVDTFLSILQPILIDWATFADEMRRQQAIMNALTDKNIEANIDKTGTALADAVDTFSAASRHGVTGAFVEQLALIREIKIDLNNVDDCKILSTTSQKDGVPSATFIGCFSGAWAKIQKDVANLDTIGDNYDKLADANTVSAKTLFKNIMSDWAVIAKTMANGGTAAYTQAFLIDLTEFITFAQAIATAASTNDRSSGN
jgi:hypothetical protein